MSADAAGTSGGGYAMARSRSVRAISEADLPLGRNGERQRIDQLAISHEPPVGWENTLAWIDPALRYPRVRLGFTPTWSESIVGYEPGQPCPGCNDSQLREHEICIVCHQTARAPRQWPMQPADERARIMSGPPPLRQRVVLRSRTSLREKIPAKPIASPSGFGMF